MTRPSEPTSKSLTVNGLALRCLEWGRPGALPVICVHGYTSSAEAFNTSSAEAFNALARHVQDPVVQKKHGVVSMQGPLQNFDGMCLPFSVNCGQASSCDCLPAPRGSSATGGPGAKPSSR